MGKIMHLPTKFLCQNLFCWVEGTPFTSWFCAYWSCACRDYARHHGSDLYPFHPCYEGKWAWNSGISWPSKTSRKYKILPSVASNVFYLLYCKSALSSGKVSLVFVEFKHCPRRRIDFSACWILRMYQSAGLNEACNLKLVLYLYKFIKWIKLVKSFVKYKIHKYFKIHYSICGVEKLS